MLKLKRTPVSSFQCEWLRNYQKHLEKQAHVYLSINTQPIVTIHVSLSANATPEVIDALKKMAMIAYNKL